MSKLNRHKTILEVIQSEEISNQDELLNKLTIKGFNLTQATLSRDMKELKIAKVHTPSGNYAYQLSNQAAVNVNEINIDLSHFGFVSIEFSGTLAVIKTRPGFAMALAGEIDKRAGKTILGTVAGDDTILIIPKETFSRSEILNSLSEFIPNIK